MWSPPSERMPSSGWNGYVGIPGGRPTNYTMFVNAVTGELGAGGTWSGALMVGDDTTDDAAALQAMVDACPDWQYVYVPAGTYKIGSSISRTGINFAGFQIPFSIMIRGAGITQTIFHFTAVSSSGAPFISFTGSTNFDARTMSIVSGNVRGSNSLILNTFDQYLATGMSVRITRLNSEAVNSTAQLGSQEYVASQLVKVLTMNNTTKEITFTPALNEAFASDFVSLSISQPYRCGLEDFTVEVMNATNGPTLYLLNPLECWIKGVKSINAGKWHCLTSAALFCEITESQFLGAWDTGGDHAYGTMFYSWSCNNLSENNIFYRLRHTIGAELGGQGNVWGYNTSVEPIGDGGVSGNYLTEDALLHGGFPRYNLFEGNIIAKYSGDYLLGGSNYNTFFRNRVTRKSLSIVTVACFGSDIQFNNHEAVSSGNILENPPSGYDPSQYGSRRWGTKQDDNSDIDEDCEATALIQGDYDYATDTLQYDESDHTLPNSLYRDSAPPHNGSLSWPYFDSTDPSASNANTSTPSAYRYTNGNWPDEGATTLTVSGGVTVSGTLSLP